MLKPSLYPKPEIADLTLLVAGDGPSLEPLLDALSGRGLDVEQTDPRTALEMSRAAVPDAVMLVGRAADRGGARLIKAFRADPELAHTRILVVGPEAHLRDPLAAHMPKTLGPEQLADIMLRVAHGLIDGTADSGSLRDLVDGASRQVARGTVSRGVSPVESQPLPVTRASRSRRPSGDRQRPPALRLRKETLAGLPAMDPPELPARRMAPTPVGAAIPGPPLAPPPAAGSLPLPPPAAAGALPQPPPAASPAAASPRPASAATHAATTAEEDRTTARSDRMRERRRALTSAPPKSTVPALTSLSQLLSAAPDQPTVQRAPLAPAKPGPSPQAPVAHAAPVPESQVADVPIALEVTFETHGLSEDPDAADAADAAGLSAAGQVRTRLSGAQAKLRALLRTTGAHTGRLAGSLRRHARQGAQGALPIAQASVQRWLQAAKRHAGEGVLSLGAWRPVHRVGDKLAPGHRRLLVGAAVAAIGLGVGYGLSRGLSSRPNGQEVPAILVRANAPVGQPATRAVAPGEGATVVDGTARRPRGKAAGAAPARATNAPRQGAHAAETANADDDDDDDDASAEAYASTPAVQRRLERANQLVAEGHRLRKQGRLGLAEAAYLRALGTLPRFPRAMAGLVRVHLQRKASAEAIRWARKLVQLQPKRGQNHLLLGDAHRQHGQLSAAKQAWRTASRYGSRVARQRLREPSKKKRR